MAIGLKRDRIQQIVGTDGAAVDERTRRFIIKIIKENNKQLERDIARIIEKNNDQLLRTITKAIRKA